MSVLVEFRLADDKFRLGRLLAHPPRMHIELERMVPIGQAMIPYLWVAGNDYRTFEQRVRGSDDVGELVALDRLESMVLYRIEWKGQTPDLLRAINENGGAVLDATGNDGWHFRVRFPDHDALSQFYNFCTEHDLNIHIERSYTLVERLDAGYQLALSQKQREALLLGLQRGHFDTPSRTTLDELGAELGISQQAMSNRIRRGTKKVLEAVLLSSAEPRGDASHR